MSKSYILYREIHLFSTYNEYCKLIPPFFNAGCMGFFCAGCLLCDISSRMGEGCCFPCYCPQAVAGLRVKLRTQENIEVGRN